ncbi:MULTISPECIES: LysR substrate-binding domain-containing protein [Paenibacillus]|uniref:LysR substrate-binding domain-containing protein n=1 Tax=Paenibacillus TaxID=44249 RepID=UPI0004355798|nr:MULTISPECIES: LysR substrate-binding domain-containing protein [Paenibacillus]CDN45883.1 Probable RuBisCO transcriptional regulator [Paenibacillus sp. P22]
MNLLKFQIVELLDKHRKVTAVAEVLGLKQPTVTYHMKSLEQEYGVKLFEPRMDKVILTEAGRALLHYAGKINSLAAEARRTAQEYGTPGRGTLRIGASYVPATYMLPRLLKEFARRHPKVTVTLAVKPSSVIKEMLLSHEIDLGVLSAEPFRLPMLDVHELCDDELVLAHAPSHYLAASPELNPGLLATADFVLHGRHSSTRELTDRWLEQHGIRLEQHLELDSLEAIKQAVIQGGHVSFVSGLAVQGEVARGLLLARPIPEFRYRRTISCASNRDRHPSGQLQSMMELLSGRIQ